MKIMKTAKKNNLKSLRLSCLVFFILFQSCHAQDNKTEKNIEDIQKSATTKSGYISYTGNVDFKWAAKIATPGVVHIKCTIKPDISKDENGNEFYTIPNPFKDFFEDEPLLKQFKFRVPKSEKDKLEPVIGSGSGVILTPNGYIITNEHLIKEAAEINVTLYDERSYTAKVVGADPQTDLALLKIEETKLPFIQYGDSDSIEVGEWVVAVGNPFNLASTVTAGIVSAKARNINILSEQDAIESFIQTDAAVNPGNSGGALVTLEGKLIGINTAIATPTGVYAGYAFAIPVDIVKKVANDILNFGSVQRGVLGVVIRDMNSTLAKEINSERANGVYVDSVTTNSAAKEAGIKQKDIIIGVDGMETITASKLQEIVMRKRPGEQVIITLLRNGKDKKVVTATLKKREIAPEVLKTKSTVLLKDLGVELAELNQQELNKYKVKNGLKITKLFEGKLKRNTNIREGFVITSVNNKKVTTINSFIEAIKNQQGGIMLEGKYAGDATIYYYAFGT
jgi:Do/DeqQ family serine protease